MKKIGILLLLTLTGCVTFKGYKTDGLTHQGADIYYNGELCARVSAVEIAYDNGKIVNEVTYLIEDVKFNHLAKGIITYVTNHKPNWEVEVEIKNFRDIYK
jgi:hypothetical protein